MTNREFTETELQLRAVLLLRLEADQITGGASADDMARHLADLEGQELDVILCLGALCLQYMHRATGGDASGELDRLLDEAMQRAREDNP